LEADSFKQNEISSGRSFPLAFLTELPAKKVLLQTYTQNFSDLLKGSASDLRIKREAMCMESMARPLKQKDLDEGRDPEERRSAFPHAQRQMDHSPQSRP
jgi:hypothetical protein